MGNAFSTQELSVPRRSVPKTLASAFALHLRSKSWRSKNARFRKEDPKWKAQEEKRLRCRALRSKRLAFKRSQCDCFLRFRDFPWARARVQVTCILKTWCSALTLLDPLSPGSDPPPLRGSTALLPKSPLHTMQSGSLAE